MRIPGLIDIHAHIGRFRGYDLSLETLLLNIKSQGVALAFVSNIDGAALPGTTANTDEETTNRVTDEVCRKHPVLRPLVWARPTAADANPVRIEYWLKSRGFKGIKFHPDFNGYAPDHPKVDAYMKLCHKYRVPALFHCGDAAAIYRMAQRHPQVHVVLYHMGFGDDHQEAIKVAAEARQKGNARLYLETAQANPAAVLQAIKTVGAEHVVFGSDATYYGRNHYIRYAPLLQTLKDQLSAEDLRRVTSGNARTLFHIR